MNTSTTDVEDSLLNITEEEEEEINEEDDLGSHFEKYVMQATKSVDNILTLDRIRQEVAVRDAMLERDSTTSSNGGAFDVMSIISKNNRNIASSVYSGFSVSVNGTLVS